MKLSNFLSADRIILNFAADSQRHALDQLVQPMIQHEAVRDPEAFIQDLLRREQEITTVMDNGVALPHARSHAVRRLALTVGIAAEPGIVFGEDGDLHSHLFFCIAVPAYAPTAHIPMLQLLAKFSRDPKRVEKLMKSKTPSVASRYLGNFKG